MNDSILELMQQSCSITFEVVAQNAKWEVPRVDFKTRFASYHKRY